MKRFPWGLTVVAALAFAILVGLGVWQVRRLAWKQALLAHVAALRTAPARPIGEALALADRGQDVEYHRVSADCAPLEAPARDAWRYALRDGQVAWRLVSACRLDDPRFDGVLVDRGLAPRFAGAMAPGAMSVDPPRSVTGILRSPGGRPMLGPAQMTAAGGPPVYRLLDRDSVTRLAAANGLRRPAPYILAVESERPAPPGLEPAALPQAIPNNHLVYAMTWFALAAILAWFYGAMLIRRLNEP
jgi:surfeit locus 1 family protein